jgi:hypothetical protein
METQEQRKPRNHSYKRALECVLAEEAKKQKSFCG